MQRCASACQALSTLLCFGALVAGCGNSPHPAGAAEANTMYLAFQERTPRHLDPTASYAVNEVPYTYAIHEPLYAYHYLKRPYTLVPKSALAVVPPRFVDAQGRALPADAPADAVAESIYDIPLRHGVLYAPHPAFATDAQGRHLYHALTAAELRGKHSPFDFAHLGTRELVAADFVYAIQRHATPRIQAPGYSILAEHIVGLDAYAGTVRTEDARLLAGASAASVDKPFLDFRKLPLAGAEALDRYTLRIRVRHRYPQFQHWLATTFLAPVPWEADAFYAQPGMAANGLSGDVWPVATGPFMLREFDADRRIVLVRNPNYHGLPYPCDGMPGDRAAGLLADCGKTMPFLDTLVFDVEKDATPLRAKFVQGYLDVPEERADWAPEFLADAHGSDVVRARDAERGFRFDEGPEPFNWYLGFNMLDPVVGEGDTPERRARHRKLRQALSIAIDWEEGYGRVFLQKAGEAAQGPVPPGVFGTRHGTPAGLNPVTHHAVDGRAVRRSIDDARRLLAEAGYPNGRDAATGRPLVLNYDYQRVPTPEFRAELDWMVRQFAKLDVQLEIRATDYNQFQRKMLAGTQQLYLWGWSADYPDAETFLALLYGPNGKARYQGENTANYANADYDALYRRMAVLDDGPDKQRLVDRMVAIVQQDAPWAWGYFPYQGGAFQAWVHNAKFGFFANDRALYYRLDTRLRARRQAEWNRPQRWPLGVLIVAAAALAATIARAHRRHERSTALAV